MRLVVAMRNRLLFFIILLGSTSLAGVRAFAQTSSSPILKSEILQIIRESDNHYKKGEQAYTENQFDRARREFDQAVDCVLFSRIDVRSDEDLRVYYRQLIEKINRFQMAAVQASDGGALLEQRHEPSPLDKIASLSDSDLQEAGEEIEDVSTKGLNFKFAVTDSVKQFVAYFTHGRGRSSMEAGLLRSARYREMARRIFKETGVPTDLIWLAQVESGWNPYAVSSAEARGIWQFIPGTGSRFGLQQDYWIDERSDPEKSTRAAAQYLKWLSTRYHGNWELALAAYNAGEGSVDGAIARTGLHDFWRMHDSGILPRETRNYVPAILAVVAIAKDPKKYGLEIPHSYTPRYDTRAIAKQTDLRQLAKKLKVSYTSLADLNPELQRGSTPPGKRTIRVPAPEPTVTTATDN